MNAARGRIDEIDAAILDLLNERFELAAGLGAAKRERRIPIYDPKREEEIIRRLLGRGARNLAPEAVVSIWREIFSASRLAQTALKVAYLGPEGTFTHQAVLARFGSAVDAVGGQTIGAVFSWLKNGAVDHAVLPVENTLQGVVGQTVDLLGATGLPFIVDEIVLPIHFVFAASEDRPERIERVYSKREAFGQCGKFLGQPSLEQAKHVHAASTAEAARQAARDPAGAALCPDIAASLAGLPIRFKNVENNAGNKTRFLILGRDQPPATGSDRTSVFARVPNVAGGLAALLRSFSEKNINLTKIESRPMDDAADFESWFYIVLDGHVENPAVAAAIREHGMVWLGSYPRRDDPHRDDRRRDDPHRDDRCRDDSRREPSREGAGQ